MSTAELAVVELTENDRRDLANCETIIRQGVQTFLEVGNALLTIRDRKLYREDFTSFEDYAKTRFGIKRSRAYQLMDAATVAENLSTRGGQIEGATEKTLRPLTKVEPNEQVKVWNDAVETAPDGRPTTKQVEEAVERVAPKAPSPEPKPEEPPHIEPQAEDYEDKGDAWEEPTDAEFVASLPLSKKLANGPLKAFQADALLYREMESSRKTFGHFASTAMSKARKNGGRNGAYYFRLNAFLRIEHPKKWLICPPTEKGGCNGEGTIPMVGDCPKCHGQGYWIVGSSI